MSLPTSLPSASDPARTALPLRRTMPKPAESDRPKPDRHFAWQVAPNLWVSFQYAWAGLTYAFQTQRNFRIHTAIALLAISVGFGLGITRVEMAIVGLTCALVMVLELVNTALESVVDLTVQKSYHDLAKIAKDCAAGAVLVSAIVSLFVASLILLPPLIALGQALLLQLT